MPYYDTFLIYINNSSLSPSHLVLLMDLLMVLIPCINYSHVVWMFKQVDHILLIQSYLITVQHVCTTSLALQKLLF